MFGKIYNVAVAFIAVSLLLLVVVGALFAVIQGLAAYFVGVDLWSPVEAVLARGFAAVVVAATDAWTWLAGQAEALLQDAPAGPESAPEPAAAPGD